MKMFSSGSLQRLGDVRTSLLVFIATGMLTAACGKTEEPAAGGEASAEPGATPAAESGEAAPAVEDKAVIDDELVADIKAIVDGCEINVDGCTVNKCKAEEEEKLKDKFKAKGTKRRDASVDTWAQALGSDDPKTQTVAANVLGPLFRRFRKGDLGEVRPGSAKRLVEALAKAPKYQAAQSVEGVTNVAMMGGQGEALYAVTAAHDYAKVLQPMVWENVMRYGRLGVFPKLEEVAKGTEEKQVAAALSSPRKMSDATAEEKAKVCPWAKGYLGHESLKAMAEAGKTMTWCEGEYIDALLDEGDARLAKGVFTRELSFVFRDICFTPMGSKVAGTPEQCDRNYAYLEKVTNDEAIDGQSRSLALFGIYYQRRDQATLDLAKKYTGHKEPEIQKRAKEIVEKLTERLSK